LSRDTSPVSILRCDSAAPSVVGLENSSSVMLARPSSISDRRQLWFLAGVQNPGLLRIDGNPCLDDDLGSLLGGLILKPLQDRLDCDGLNFYASILPRFGPVRQMRTVRLRRQKTVC
jgi:hypothetical protein